jgi:hypothetical protein
MYRTGKSRLGRSMRTSELAVKHQRATNKKKSEGDNPSGSTYQEYYQLVTLMLTEIEKFLYASLEVTLRFSHHRGDIARHPTIGLRSTKSPLGPGYISSLIVLL